MSSNSQKYTIYLIPHTHYDAIWVFSKEDYFYINIDLILKKVVELMEKDKNYHFLIEQTYLLEEIERRNPWLFEKIKRFIQEGRIEVADGEFLMADTVLPLGETLVRQILRGKRYLKQKFGIEVPVMWQADSFGLNAQLPQIWKKSGYKYCAFRRGVEKKAPSEFWWKGLDGSKILAHWMPLGYRAGLNLEKLEESFNTLRQLSATKNILMPSGSGVTLPQPETSAVVKKWNSTHKDSRMKIGGLVEFFEKVEKEKKLEEREGEQFCGRFSEVFPNCASSRMWVKQALRKYENLILTTENFATISYVLGFPYPFNELKVNWRKVLFGAFHDAVPGTGTDECYGEIKRNFKFLRVHLGEVLNHSLGVICRHLKEREDIVVFNSLPWEVRDWVEVNLSFEKGEIKRIEGVKNGKEEIETEMIEATKYDDGSFRTAKIGFLATVPPLGYKSYKILEKLSKRPQSQLKILKNTISNRFFKIKIDPITGLIDVFRDDQLIVSQGNEIVLEEELGDLYYHRQQIKDFIKTEGGEGIKYGKFKLESLKVQKKSNQRVVVEMKVNYYALRWPYRLVEKLKPLLWRHKVITLLKKIIIYNDLERIDFITRLKDQHPQARIRVRFPTTVKSSHFDCETQFGVVKRPVDMFYFKADDTWKEKPCGVYPALNWINYSDEKKGIAIFNKGLPAHEVRDGKIYLTLLRSILMLSSDGKTGPAIPTPEAQEFKTYTYHYALFPHQKKDVSLFSRKAKEFNRPLIAFPLPREKEKPILPSKFSFLNLSPKNLILSALKKAEGKKDVILRFYETEGRETKAEINLFEEPKSVKMVNLLEEEEKEKREIRVKRKKISLLVKPFEIVTLKIKFF